MSIPLHYIRNGQVHDLNLYDTENSCLEKNSIILDGRKYVLEGDSKEVDFLIGHIRRCARRKNIPTQAFKTRLLQLGVEEKSLKCRLFDTAQKIEKLISAAASDSICEITCKLDAIVMQEEFSGSVLVAQKGKILLKKDYGHAANRKKMDAELTYRWGSISKTITAIAVLKLAEDGEIELDKPITEYLDEYKDAKKYPGLHEVTVRQLLSHTSKAPDHYNYLEKLIQEKLSSISNPNTRKRLKKQGELNKFKAEIEEEYFFNRQEPKDMVKGIMSLPLLEKPSDYNNFAFTLLGLLVERKGKSYEKYVQENIFARASMGSAQIAINSETDCPNTEGFLTKNKRKRHVTAPVDDAMVRFASGNINGSVWDLYQFDRALNQGRLLGDHMLMEMQDQRLGFDPLVLAPAKVAGKQMIAKSGVMAGVRTVYQYFPQEDVTIIILGNSDLDVCPLGERMAHVLFNSSALVTYTPLRSALCMIKDFFLQRIATESEKVVDEIANILKNDPEFAPYAFDIALHAEQIGNKQIADKIRELAIATSKVSSPSPTTNDPRFLTPPLTGKYPVGVKSFYVEDTSRNEKKLEHKVDRARRLEINVHYPSIQNKKPAYKVDPNIENLVHPDPLKKEQFGNLWTRSQLGLEPSSEEKFPIVIFSHGWGQNHHEYQHIVEELASHGFCVITINHPYSSYGSIYLGNSQDVSYLDEFEKLDETKKARVIEKEVMTNANDIEFVLKQIKNGHIKEFENVFGNCLDYDNVGVFGHSMGGAAALQVCRDFPLAVKAGINIDGKIFQVQKSKNTIAQPFLIIGANSNGALKEEKEWDKLKQSNPDLVKRVDISYTAHRDFTIVPLYLAVEDGKHPEDKKIKKREKHVEHLKNKKAHVGHGSSGKAKKASLNMQIQEHELRSEEQKNKSHSEKTRKTNREIVSFFNQHLKSMSL